MIGRIFKRMEKQNEQESRLDAIKRGVKENAGEATFELVAIGGGFGLYNTALSIATKLDAEAVAKLTAWAAENNVGALNFIAASNVSMLRLPIALARSLIADKDKPTFTKENAKNAAYFGGTELLLSAAASEGLEALYIYANQWAGRDMSEISPLELLMMRTFGTQAAYYAVNAATEGLLYVSEKTGLTDLAQRAGSSVTSTAASFFCCKPKAASLDDGLLNAHGGPASDADEADVEQGNEKRKGYSNR